MKKSILNSIILSAAILGLGVQANHATTVHAEENNASEETAGSVSKTDTGTSAESKESSQESNNESSSSEGNSQETSDSNESNLQTHVNYDVPDVTVDTSDVVIREEDQDKGIEKTPIIDVAKDQKATNRDMVDGAVEIRPTESALNKYPDKRFNYHDPADDGDLMVPYTYHGNGAIFELDPETHQLIVDEGSVTGYKQISARDVYGDDLTDLSDSFTGLVYDVYYSHNGENQTEKDKLLQALGKEGTFFMEFYNHGYNSRNDLSNYIDAFDKKKAELEALGDDGKPVVEDQPITTTTPTKSHSHRSSSTESTSSNNNNTDPVDLTITTIRQANLYTKDGKFVGNRGLTNDSTWRVQETALINGQKMYRVTANEWVAAKDVK